MHRPSSRLPTGLVICMECGSWSEVGASRAMKQECKGHPPSKHAINAIRRVKQGLHPKPGASTKGASIEGLVPLREALADALEESVRGDYGV